MANRVKIISLNVRGLWNQVKRRSLFSYVKNQKSNFVLSSGNFSREDDEKIRSAKWGGQIIFPYGSEHSRGVCMLLSINSGFSLGTMHTDRNRRYIIAKGNIGDKQLFVTIIYSPNKGTEQELFIRSLGANLILKTDIMKIIITGNWNGSLFPNLAAFGGKKQTTETPLSILWKN